MTWGTGDHLWARVGRGSGSRFIAALFCAFFNRRTFARFTVTGWARDSNWPAADTLVEIVLLGLGVWRAVQPGAAREDMLHDHGLPPS